MLPTIHGFLYEGRAAKELLRHPGTESTVPGHLRIDFALWTAPIGRESVQPTGARLVLRN